MDPCCRSFGCQNTFLIPWAADCEKVGEIEPDKSNDAASQRNSLTKCILGAPNSKDRLGDAKLRGDCILENPPNAPSPKPQSNTRANLAELRYWQNRLSPLFTSHERCSFTSPVIRHDLSLARRLKQVSGCCRLSRPQRTDCNEAEYACAQGRAKGPFPDR
jgi:hypothetical protein